MYGWNGRSGWIGHGAYIHTIASKIFLEPLAFLHVENRDFFIRQQYLRQSTFYTLKDVVQKFSSSTHTLNPLSRMSQHIHHFLLMGLILAELLFIIHMLGPGSRHGIHVRP